MIDTAPPVPLTPDHLRAIIVYGIALAHAHYAYADWLEAHDYGAQAAQVRAEGDEAFNTSQDAGIDLSVWKQTVGPVPSAERT